MGNERCIQQIPTRRAPLRSTEEVPVFVIPGGHHCSDSFLSQSVNPGVKAVQEAEIAYVKKWVAEFYEQKDST